jgi:hypothetical protein
VLDQESVEEPPDATLLGDALNVTVGAGDVTVTVADWFADPPVPEQVSTYVEFAVTAPVDCVPDVDFVPDHAPLAEHELALVLDQERVDEPPDATLLGDALNMTVGAGDVTVTVADWFADPPVPEQVSAYVEFAVTAPVDCVPDVDFVPDHAPLAEHELTLVLDQESVDDPPDATLAGEALNVTVGRGAAATVTVADWLADPPAPVQANV